MNLLRTFYSAFFCISLATPVFAQDLSADVRADSQQANKKSAIVNQNQKNDYLFAENETENHGSLGKEGRGAAESHMSSHNEKQQMRDFNLEKKIQLALDYMEIQNVMAKHVYYFNAQKQYEELDDIWSKAPDIAYGHNSGFKVGQESVRNYYGGMNERQRKKKLEIMSRLYPDVENVKENEGIGDLVMMPVQTPYIEVAGDGKTAKGLWFLNGMNFEIGPDGKPVAYCFWGKMGVDFIKENGKWKIWHLVGYDDVMWQNEQSWVDNINPPLERTVPEDENWDKLKEPPYQAYSAKRLPQYDPEPPEPYETWDDSMSYVQ